VREGWQKDARNERGKGATEKGSSLGKDESGTMHEAISKKRGVYLLIQPITGEGPFHRRKKTNETIWVHHGGEKDDKERKSRVVVKRQWKEGLSGSKAASRLIAVCAVQFREGRGSSKSREG